MLFASTHAGVLFGGKLVGVLVQQGSHLSRREQVNCHGHPLERVCSVCSSWRHDSAEHDCMYVLVIAVLFTADGSSTIAVSIVAPQSGTHSARMAEFHGIGMEFSYTFQVLTRLLAVFDVVERHVDV